MDYDSEALSPPNLSSYITTLLASGRLVFSASEAQRSLGIGRGAFLDAAEKLHRRRRLLRLRHSFYVIVPPQDLNFGSPLPASFIDDLMRHEGRPYYVGLLKAAELHGSAHHAVMEFQVMSDKQIPSLAAGRSKIVFYVRRDMDAVASAVEDHKTDTGKMKVASVELTLFDLLRYPQASGGLDNVLTIFEDLGRKLDAVKMQSLCEAFERSIVQRAGYLLERAGLEAPAEKLLEFLARSSRVNWSELDPSLASNPELAAKVRTRDERWHLIVRRLPEREA